MLHRLAAVARGASVEVVHPLAVCPVLGRLTNRRHLPPTEQIRNLTVYHRPYRYLPGVMKRCDGHFYYRGLIRWLRRHCARDRPDLLDGHFAWPDGVGVSYLARAMKLPYTITLRGTINPRYRTACFRGRMSRSLRDAAAVISVSAKMAEIAAELGVAAERIHVIPNGVDTEVFTPLPREEARQGVGLAQHGRLVVCVASLKPQKGHEDLLEAMEKLPADVRLVIIGVESGRGGYRRQLTAYAAARGLTERVRFAGGQPQSKVAMYYSAADVSVLASHSEGCPNVVLESLACGTPVVATAVGGVPEILRSGENGLMVAARSPTALADGMRAALARDWSRDRVRRSVADRSWQAVADQVLSVFRSALGNRRGSLPEH